MRPWNPKVTGFDSLSNFMGEVPDSNLLVLLSRNRDSSLLAESNWDTVLKFLGGESESVRIIRHGHWACGWIEYLMIDSTDKDILGLAESVESKLSDYPVWDEDDYYSRVYEAAYDYWEHATMGDRVYECQRARVSVFAARRNYNLPDGLIQHLEEIVEH